MTLRRYAPVKASKGTVIPPAIRETVTRRDVFCVGYRVGFPIEGRHLYLELDHVRASHGIGMKSRTEADNLVLLCGQCHRWKTENGREARPLLLGYLERVGDPHAGHVDPCPECPPRRNGALAPQAPESSR